MASEMETLEVLRESTRGAKLVNPTRYGLPLISEAQEANSRMFLVRFD